MANIDGSIIVAELPGLLSAQDATERALVEKSITDRTLRFPIAATTILATALTAIGSTGQKYVIKSVDVVTTTGVTAGTTDYFTVAVEKNDGAGGSNTVVATANATTVGTGNWTAKSIVNIPVVVTSSANILASGSALYVNVTKTGSTGLVSPAFAIEVVVSPIA